MTAASAPGSGNDSMKSSYTKVLSHNLIDSDMFKKFILVRLVWWFASYSVSIFDIYSIFATSDIIYAVGTSPHLSEWQAKNLFYVIMYYTMEFSCCNATNRLDNEK